MAEGVEESYEVRPDRPCMGCGKTDKAPRDQQSNSDGSVSYFHMDCHAMMGCETCQKVLDAVAQGHGPDGKKNEELWNKLVEQMNLPPEEQEEIFTTPDASGQLQDIGTEEELRAAGLES